MRRLATVGGVIVVGIVAGAWWTGDLDVRAVVDAAGPLGPVVMLTLFAAAPLGALPGLPLIGVSLVAYGPVAGSAISAVGCVLFVTTPFVATRRARPASVRLPGWTARLLRLVERRPILAVAGLRLATQLSAPVSAALALTSIRFRDYLLGSLAGFGIPLSAFILLFGR